MILCWWVIGKEHIHKLNRQDFDDTTSGILLNCYFRLNILGLPIYLYKIPSSFLLWVRR